jgi:hypothetical protein
LGNPFVFFALFAVVSLPRSPRFRLRRAGRLAG